MYSIVLHLMTCCYELAQTHIHHAHISHTHHTPHYPPAGASVYIGAKRGDGDTGVFMVQRCAVHCSGALLLEPSDGDAYDARLQARQGPPAAPVVPPAQPGNNALDDGVCGGWSGVDATGVGGDVHMQGDGGHDLPMWDDGGVHDDDDDDHDQGGYVPPSDAPMDTDVHGMCYCC